MANVPESSSYDAGIYQLEIVDEVLGGVNGKANSQAKGLANRTKWLKDQVDTLNLLKGKGVPAFSAANSYVGGDMVIYQKNIWVANTSITPAAWNATQWTKQLGNAAESALADAAPLMNGVAAAGVSTDLAREDHVHPADTGREPAIAAGTVSQFWAGTKAWRDLATDVRAAILTGLSTATSTVVAATDSILVAIGKLQAQITLRATLASPTFTGNPTAPTPATSDNDTSIATTAFVQAQKQSSNTDDTPGALMGVGAFGVGGAIDYSSDPDLNNLLNSGFYYASNASPVNYPVGSNSGLVIVSGGGSSNVHTQMFYPIGDRTKAYFRTFYVTWGAWIEIAGIDSPAFTGNPVAPTPAQFDNDTSLATTAFVQRALGSMAGIRNISGNTTLTAADAGKMVIFTVTPTFTVTLPLLSALPNGACIILKSDTAGTVTVQRQGSDTISSNGGSLTSIQIRQGEWVILTREIVWRAFGSAVLTTRAQFDNSISAASTEFVQRALGNFANSRIVGAPITLTAADFGSSIWCTADGSVTLPAASSGPVGASIHLWCTASVTGATVLRAGADLIYLNTGTVTSVKLSAGDSLWLVNRGDAWLAIGGSAQLGSAAVFQSSLAASGFQKLPSGLIIQWGMVSGINNSAGVNVTFPLAFPTGCFAVVATHVAPGSGPGARIVETVIRSATYFDAYGNTTANAVYWIAIGR